MKPEVIDFYITVKKIRVLYDTGHESSIVVWLRDDKISHVLCDFEISEPNESADENFTKKWEEEHREVVLDQASQLSPRMRRIFRSGGLELSIFTMISYLLRNKHSTLCTMTFKGC